MKNSIRILQTLFEYLFNNRILENSNIWLQYILQTGRGKQKVRFSTPTRT